MRRVTDEGITPERIDELLAFLPRFKEPGREFILRWEGGNELESGAIQIPFPVYPDDVREFFRLASQPWWCDYEYVPAEAGSMIQDAERIERATLEEIKTMLTFCVRGERFSDGLWGHMLETGRITAILERLAKLRENL